MELLLGQCPPNITFHSHKASTKSISPIPTVYKLLSRTTTSRCLQQTTSSTEIRLYRKKQLRPVLVSAAASTPQPLDLTEENIELVLSDAKVELGQLFDTSVGMTGTVELADLDGPFVKIRLKGRFWHERSMVVARIGNYLQKRIPEILEVEIEDEKQLDDSPENF